SSMDDVWLILGLLLFGSLLFCLCCYKVTNLLYMLYHIDDTEIESLDISPLAEEGPGNGVTATAVASGDEIKDYRLLNNVAASTGGLLYSSGVTSNALYSSQSLIEKKHSSVSSLSVGVQCDSLSLSELRNLEPRKALMGSSPSIHNRLETARIPSRAPLNSSTSSLKPGAFSSPFNCSPRYSCETDFGKDWGLNPACRRHNPQRLFDPRNLIHTHHHHHASLLRDRHTANHVSAAVPCQFFPSSSFDCIQAEVGQSRTSSNNNPYCKMTRLQKAISSHHLVEDSLHATPGGFIIIPPPVDFCANSRFSDEEGEEETILCHASGRGLEENEDESEENEYDEDEDDVDLLICKRTEPSNPYSNSPTSLC
ncbi:Uncharacterized protein FKW44_011612, partial [Caligus rogercresseyi]